MQSQDNNKREPTQEDALLASILRLHDWQDKQSWNEVYRQYYKLVYTVARQCGLNETEAWDAVQETFVSLAKQSLKGSYDPKRGSFKSWLLQMAQWRSEDQLSKRAQASEELPPGDVPDSQAENLDRRWERKWKMGLLHTALAKVREKSPRQAQLFESYVLQGKSAAEVARQFNVNPEQVYLAKHRVSLLLQQEIEELRRSEN